MVPCGAVQTQSSAKGFSLSTCEIRFIYVNGMISRSCWGVHLVLTRTRSHLLSKEAGAADGGPL